MNKRVVLFLLCSRSVGSLAALGASVVLSRELGPVGRGDVAGLLALLWTVRICASGGMQQAVALGDTREEGGLLLLGAVVAVAGGFASLLAADALGIDGGIDSGVLWTIVVLSTPLFVLSEWALGVAVGRKLHLANASIRLVPEVARLVVFIIGAWLGILTSEGASAVTVLAFAFPVLLVLLWWSRVRDARWLVSGFGRMAAAHPGSVSRLLTRRVDQLLLGVILGPAELGLYATAVAISEAPFVAIQGIQSYISRASAGSSRRSLVCLFDQLFLAGTCVGIGGAAASWFVMVPLFGPAFAAARLPAVVLLLSTPFLLAGSVGGAAIAGVGLAGRESRIQAVGLGANVLLLLVLVRFGALGAALASGAAYGVVAVAVRWEMSRMLTEAPRQDESSMAKGSR